MVERKKEGFKAGIDYLFFNRSYKEYLFLSNDLKGDPADRVLESIKDKQDRSKFRLEAHSDDGSYYIYHPFYDNYVFLSEDKLGSPPGPVDRVTEGRKGKQDRGVFQLIPAEEPSTYYIYNPSHDEYLFVSEDKLGEPAGHVVEGRKGKQDRGIFEIIPISTPVAEVSDFKFVLEKQYEELNKKYWEHEKRIQALESLLADKGLFSDKGLFPDKGLFWEDKLLAHRYDSVIGRLGAWELIGGALKHVSVSATHQVFGVNASDVVYEHVGGNEIWREVPPGRLIQISIGADEIWGVNDKNQVWRILNNKQYQLLYGSLKYVSVSPDGKEIWGVNMNDTIYYYVDSPHYWEEFQGKLMQISVGPGGEVWGVNSNNEIYRSVRKSPWEKIGGSLKHVSIGPDGSVWGVNKNDEIYHYLGGNNWEKIDGALKQISVGKGVVWGVNKNDQIYTVKIQIK